MPNLQPSSQSDLEEPVAALLARLAAGWSPLPYAPPTIVSVTHDDDDLTDRFLGLRIEEDFLVLRFRVGLTDLIANGPVVIVTEDGGQIEAQVGPTEFMFAAGPSLGELTVTCREWIAQPAERPLLWIGRLKGARILRGAGNLRIVRPEGDGARSSEGHLVLNSPNNRLIIIWPEVGGDPCWLVVESNEELVPQAVWRDRMLLRVVLGSAIDVDSFVAVDSGGEPVGMFVDSSSVGGRDVGKTVEPLVPLRPSVEGGISTWAAPFFRKLSEAYVLDGPPDPLTIAVFRYGHSLAPMDVDTEFVMVAGAVSVLLQSLAGEGESPIPPAAVVLEGLDAAEAALRRSDDVALRAALVTLASYLNGDREREYLVELDDAAGLAVYREVLEARSVWDRGTIRPPGSEETLATALEGFARVQRLRRAFAVLLAHGVGYGGPVGRFQYSIGEGLGWLRGPELNSEDEEAAAIRYVATTTTAVSPVWPGFRPPRVPDTPVIRALVAFADGIRERTREAVTARLRPLPRRDDEPQRLSFRLVLTAAPSVHVALFSVQAEGEGATILGWTDGARELTTPGEVGLFGAEVAQSEELRFQVERLMLIGDDVRRGETAQA